MASLDSLPTELIYMIVNKILEEAGKSWRETHEHDDLAADPPNDLVDEAERTALITPLLSVNGRLRDICVPYRSRTLDLTGMSLEQLQQFNTSFTIWRSGEIVRLVVDHASMWQLCGHRYADHAQDQEGLGGRPRTRPNPGATAIAKIVSFCPHPKHLTVLGAPDPSYELYDVFSSLNDSPYFSELRGLRALDLFDEGDDIAAVEAAELIEHLPQLEELCITIGGEDFSVELRNGVLREAISQHRKLKDLKLRTDCRRGNSFNPEDDAKPWLAPIQRFTWMMIMLYTWALEPRPDHSMLPYLAQFRDTVRELVLVIEDFDDFNHVHFPSLKRLDFTFRSLLPEHLQEVNWAA